MTTAEEIGRRIKAHREYHNWSQSELAQRIEGGIGKQSIISEIERGKRGLQVDELLQIAEVLGVHPYFHILAADNDPFSQVDSQPEVSQIETILLHNFRRLASDKLRMSVVNLLMAMTDNADTTNYPNE